MTNPENGGIAVFNTHTGNMVNFLIDPYFQGLSRDDIASAHNHAVPVPGAGGSIISPFGWTAFVPPCGASSSANGEQCNFAGTCVDSQCVCAAVRCCGGACVRSQFAVCSADSWTDRWCLLGGWAHRATLVPTAPHAHLAPSNWRTAGASSAQEDLPRLAATMACVPRSVETRRALATLDSMARYVCVCGCVCCVCWRYPLGQPVEV